ncbi:TPA: DUF262 domain-containing protein [Enterobacter kobei]|nr:DUF262 domain-containing protein [Enterobacter kobei]
MMSERKTTIQEITWFLDLYDSEKIDLDPPYQRRSVWTRKDKQYFLDTIFKQYPCPAVFLHKTQDDKGRATYHVVDGKQRLQTIFDFVNNKIPLGQDIGDERLNGKRWKQIEDPDLKKSFWDYVLPVDLLTTVDKTVVDNIFDRLNRNSRKLERQELRHAKYDGWFIKLVETAAELPFLKTIGVVTTGRAKRMKDVQFISELALAMINNDVCGFDQDELDAVYAKYDNSDDEELDFNYEEFEGQFYKLISLLERINEVNNVIKENARLHILYSIFTYLALTKREQILHDEFDVEEFSNKLKDFLLAVAAGSDDPNVNLFKSNLLGANTEYQQRKYRFDAMVAYIG